jgi:hypothetical protein
MGDHNTDSNFRFGELLMSAMTRLTKLHGALKNKVRQAIAVRRRAATNRRNSAVRAWDH